MLHEFEKECGVEMNPSQFIRPGKASSSRVLTTEPLLPYVRAATIARLKEYGVPPNLKAGDWVYDRFSSDKKPFQVKEVLGHLKYKIDQLGYKKVPSADLIRVDTPEEIAQQELDTSQVNLDIVPMLTLRKELRLVDARIQPEAIGGSPLTRCLRTVTELVGLSHFDVMLSVRILCSAITYGLVSIFPSRIKTIGFDDTGLTSFEKDMTEANWCPMRIDWLRCSSFRKQYVASLLPSHEKASHRGCSTRECSLRPTSLDQMQPKHKSESCNGVCQSVIFDEAELVRILRSGGIPGVEQRQTEQGLSYHIVDVIGREYIAISHVWSHGLGNPATNALPLCRVLDLFELIRTISSPHALLWIDTLTVPVEPGAKILAIRQLRTVFAQATKVLVVDFHLMQVGTDGLERKIQLRSSEWMRRLWTLQEGRLSSQLYIQFKKGAVSVTEVLQGPAEDSTHYDKSVFGCLDWISYSMLGPFFSALTSRGIEERFLDIVDDLAVRSATVATDEIRIATLLGLELENFASSPTMMDIYRAAHSLPADLLFVTSPRLDIPGFRWAPATFMNRK